MYKREATQYDNAQKRDNSIYITYKEGQLNLYNVHRETTQSVQRTKERQLNMYNVQRQTTQYV